MSIPEIILQNMDNILANHVSHSSLFNKYAPNLREDLVNNGTIISYDQVSHSHASLIAVDGARASEDLSGGDLMVAGATAAEGHSSAPVFDGEEPPAEAWSKILPHKPNNTDIVADIMYALELRILGRVKADTKIIDGAYIANVSHLLFALTGGKDLDVQRIDELFESIDGDKDNVLRNVYEEIMYPPRDNSSTIVSLPKSDTAKVYSKQFFGDDHKLYEMFSDRVLANRLLLPGEMFLPRNINSNPALIQKLSNFNPNKYDGDFKDLYQDLIKDKIGLLRRLGIQDNTEEGILWTTYFKPHVFLPYSKTLKIEFPYYRNKDQNIQGAVDHAQHLVSKIDDDIIDPFILEPWSQYAVDRKAKEVSVSLNLVKENLINSEINDEYSLSGLIRGYRT